MLMPSMKEEIRLAYRVLDPWRAYDQNAQDLREWLREGYLTDADYTALQSYNLKLITAVCGHGDEQTAFDALSDAESAAFHAYADDPTDSRKADHNAARSALVAYARATGCHN